MEKLTESEIYIIDSLFERKQIDKQRLIKAISILPEEIKDFYNIGLREAKDIVDGIPSVLDTTLRVGNEVIDKSKTLEFQNFILRLKDIGCTIDLILK